jgi:hypothetical protein
MFLHRPRSQMNRNFAFKDFSSWIRDYAKIDWKQASVVPRWVCACLHSGRYDTWERPIEQKYSVSAGSERARHADVCLQLMASRKQQHARSPAKSLRLPCYNYKGQRRFGHPCTRHKRSVKVQRWSIKYVGHYRIVNRLVINHFFSFYRSRCFFF